MNLEYLFTVAEFGEVDKDLAVETSGTEQCLVEHIDAVGRCKAYHTIVRLEAIHLGEHLVEGILSFVVRSQIRVATASTTHSVDLIDEDDTGCLLFGLFEKVANACGTHTYEHLHEVRTGNGEEGHVSFTRYCLRQKGLTCTRRTDKECTAWDLGAQFGVALWILQKLHNLLYLHFRFCQTGYILELDICAIILVEYRGLRFSHTEDATGASGTT